MLRRQPRGAETRRDDARARIILEALGVEHAVLASVEGERNGLSFPRLVVVPAGVLHHEQGT
jgi:hypothetical protein